MTTSGFYGDRFELLMGVQADFNTVNTTDHIKLPLRSVAPNRGRETSEASLLGQGRNLPNKTHRGLISPDFSMAVPVEVDSIGYHLTGFFGAPTTTGASAPYSHLWTWNEGTADPPYYTAGLEYVDRAGTRAAVRFGKCIYNSMQISFQRDSSPLNMNFGLLAAQVTEGVATHDATPTVLTLGEELRNFQTLVRIGGDVDTQTTTIGVTGFDMTVTRNLTHNHGELQNADTASGYLPGEVIAITGTLSLVARSNAIRTLATAFSPIKLALQARVAGSANYLQMNSDLLLLDEFDWQVDGLGLHTASVPFRIQQPGIDPPGAGAAPLRVTLLNSTADYANFLPA